MRSEEQWPVVTLSKSDVQYKLDAEGNGEVFDQLTDDDYAAIAKRCTRAMEEYYEEVFNIVIDDHVADIKKRNPPTPPGQGEA